MRTIILSATFAAEYVPHLGPISEPKLARVLLMFITTRLWLLRSSGKTSDVTSAGPATFARMTSVKFWRLNGNTRSS